MNSNNFFLLSDGKDRVIFHKKTGMIANVPENVDTVTEKDFELLEKKLENVKEVTAPELKKFGEGKITLTYMSSRTCNMGCKYCFAGEGEYGGCADKPSFFTKEMYFKGYYKALECYPEGVQRISFFGGEPLLNYSEIRDFVTELCTMLNENGEPVPEFTMTTNGTVLNDEIIDFLKEYDFRIAISIDGGKEINDSARCFRGNGVSAYEAAASKIRALEESGKVYSLQATLNLYHLKDYKSGDGIRWIKQMERFNYCNLSVVPVETPVKELSIASEEVLRNLESFTREIMRYFFDKIANGNINGLSSLMLMPLIKLAKREYNHNCSSGRSFFWDTDGSAYPCHMFCNDKDYRIGGMDEDFDSERANSFISHQRTESEVCRNCIAEKSCFVWCKGIQYISSGDIYNVCSPRCVFQKAIVEESVLLIARLKKNKAESARFWKNYGAYQDSLRNTFKNLSYERIQVNA